MVDTIVIDGVEIPFSIEWKRIAISLSGGADSGMLAYILCDLITKTNADIEVHVISHTRMWKVKPWQAFDSLNVYNWLVKQFPNIIFKRHTGFIAPELEWGTQGPTITDEYGKLVSGDNLQIRAYAEYICFHEFIDAYFNGVTRNPRNTDLVGMLARDIDPDENNQKLLIMQHMGKLACHPFRFTEKSWIVKQYFDNQLLDLFNLTRSCEGKVEGIDYKNYTPGQYVPTCGECFWCKERAWAIEQNK
jgi:hypothetical protein